MEKAPLLSLSVVSCIVTYFAQVKGGAVRTLEVYPLGVRVANALVHMKYAWKMIWPSGLAAYYPHPAATIPAWEVAGAAVLLAGITALVMALGRRRPYLAAGWLWYLVTLVPVIGFVQVGTQAMADRYTLCIADRAVRDPGLGHTDLVIPLHKAGAGALGERSRVVYWRVLAGVVLALAVCSYVQVGYWRDTVTLFTRALEVTPDNPLAHNNLGRALLMRANRSRPWRITGRLFR